MLTKLDAETSPRTRTTKRPDPVVHGERRVALAGGLFPITNANVLEDVDERALPEHSSLGNCGALRLHGRGGGDPRLLPAGGRRRGSRAAQRGHRLSTTSLNFTIEGLFQGVKSSARLQHWQPRPAPLVLHAPRSRVAHIAHVQGREEAAGEAVQREREKNVSGGRTPHEPRDRGALSKVRRISKPLARATRLCANRLIYPHTYRIRRHV